MSGQFSILIATSVNGYVKVWSGSFAWVGACGCFSSVHITAPVIIVAIIWDSTHFLYAILFMIQTSWKGITNASQCKYWWLSYHQWEPFAWALNWCLRFYTVTHLRITNNAPCHWRQRLMLYVYVILVSAILSGNLHSLQAESAL